MSKELKVALDSLAYLEKIEQEMMDQIDKIVAHLQECRKLQYKAMQEIERLTEGTSATQH